MKGFWRVKGMFSTRKLVLMGLFVAMTAVLSPLDIYLSDDFRLLSFRFLPGALGSILFGPWAGLLMGFPGDFLAFLINPHGGYFPGYALSDMVSNFLFALCLYRRPVTWPRVLTAQALVGVIVSLGLGSVWLHMMWGSTAGELFTGFRLLKTLAAYPLNAALVYGLGRAVMAAAPRFLRED